MAPSRFHHSATFRVFVFALTPGVMVAPSRSTLTTAIFLQLSRNNSMILVNKLFKHTLQGPTLIYPGIAAGSLLPEHHGSVTPHKAKVRFLHPGGEGQKQVPVMELC